MRSNKQGGRPFEKEREEAIEREEDDGAQDLFGFQSEEEEGVGTKEAPIRRPRNLAEPTAEEREKHWATHLT